MFVAYSSGFGGVSYVLSRWSVGKSKWEWMAVDNGMFLAKGGEVHSICADDEELLFVATTQGVYAWDNSGSLWYNVSLRIPANVTARSSAT
jgi:hypothetical protein